MDSFTVSMERISRPDMCEGHEQKGWVNVEGHTEDSCKLLKWLIPSEYLGFCVYFILYCV